MRFGLLLLICFRRDTFATGLWRWLWQKPGNTAAVDASRVSLSRLVLIPAASEVTPARVANLGCRH